MTVVSLGDGFEEMGDKSNSPPPSSRRLSVEIAERERKGSEVICKDQTTKKQMKLLDLLRQGSLEDESCVQEVIVFFDKTAQKRRVIQVYFLVISTRWLVGSLFEGGHLECIDGG